MKIFLINAYKKKNFFQDSNNYLDKISMENVFLKDINGQLSLEFLLISFLAILILVSITLPLANLGIDLAMDSSNALEVKSEVSKIANGLDSVYSNGAGSKRTIAIEVPNEVIIRFSKDPNFEMGLATVNQVLSDGSTKKIEVNYKYPNLNTNLHLSKGYNKVIVEWPSNSSEIIVYKTI